MIREKSQAIKEKITACEIPHPPPASFANEIFIIKILVMNSVIKKRNKLDFLLKLSYILWKSDKMRMNFIKHLPLLMRYNLSL